MPYRFRNKHIFPIKPGNAFRLLIDGQQFYPQMLAGINSAQHVVMFEQYLVSSGRTCDDFIHALINAARRQVRVCVLFDGYGASALSAADSRRLVDAGIELVFYNPVKLRRFYHNFFRTHRKILIVDNRLAFVGGAGITDEFSPHIKGEMAWHDVMLEIHGPVIADWQALFMDVWQRSTRQPLQTQLAPPAACIEDQIGQVLQEGPFRGQAIKQALLNRINKATQRIWITTPYFIVPMRIRRALRRAAQRGLDVRLLLPGPHSDIPWVSNAARRFYMGLLKNNIRIFEFQPRFTHSKIEMCDNWVSLGSSNLDRWNQYWNLDANQAVEDEQFTAHILDYFTKDFAKSREITLAEWQQRPWRLRVREYLSGLLVYWLEKLTHQFRKID